MIMYATSNMSVAYQKPILAYIYIHFIPEYDDTDSYADTIYEYWYKRFDIFSV